MDFSSPPAVAAIVAGAVALVTAGITAWITQRVANSRALVDEKLALLRGDIDRQLTEAKARFDKDLAEQKAQLDNKTVFAAERVAHELMMDGEWRWRSFRVIKHHLGGFEDDELRKILVRAGAIRGVAADGQEVWGLLDRNRRDIGVQRLSTTTGSRQGDRGQVVVQDFG